MSALFALGVMNLGWMAFLVALIAIEKPLPWRLRGLLAPCCVRNENLRFAVAAIGALEQPLGALGAEHLARSRTGHRCEEAAREKG